MFTPIMTATGGLSVVIKYCRGYNLIFYHTNDSFPTISIRRLSRRFPLCSYSYNVSALIFPHLNLPTEAPPLLSKFMRGRNFCTAAKTRVDNEYDNEFFLESIIDGIFINLICHSLFLCVSPSFSWCL